MKTPNNGGRPRLSIAEKARRGTLRPSRERARQRRESPREKSLKPITRDYVAIAHQYLRDVLTGGIVASKWVRLACERQERDLKRAAADRTWTYVWSNTHVADACSFVERCPHIEGQWQSPLIVLQPWQVFQIACLFGWRHRDDALRRRFTTLYLEVARKAAKSTLMASIALYHLLREQEPGASVICGANTGQQARIVFAIMAKMVQRSAWLREQGASVYAHAILTEDGSAKPINAKASTQDGLNPSCIVLDESHAQSFELHDVLKSAQGARPNPLLLCPTTAGYDLLSVGYALRQTLTKVLEQVFEAEHLLGAIYTIDEGDDWRDESVWQKANPMIGVTPKLDWVRQYCRDAQQTPGLEGEFRVKVCSQWLSSSSAWLSMTQWDACTDTTLRLDGFAGALACIGGDLAQRDDLAALAITFMRDDVLYGFVKFYLPRIVVEQRARAVPAYRVWAEQGLLTLTEGNTLDERVIEADLRQWCERFDVRAIAFDQFGSAGITTRLASDGLPAVLTPKNAKTFTEPSRDLEVRVRQRLFLHDGNEILRWNASNAHVSRRVDDSLLPKKDAPDSPHKIDGLDALLLAMGGLSRTLIDEAVSGSVWERDDYEMLVL